WQSTILISKQFNKENVLKKGLERIEGLYFAEGAEEGYISYDVAAKEFDKDACQAAVRELIAEIILNNVKLQFILSSLGKRAIDTSLCTLISSMLYYDNKKEEEFVKRQIANLNNYCVDGIVNFRLRELSNEWKELGSIILNTLGKGFGEKEIYSLALYMLGERKDTSLFIADSREILITNVTQGGLVKVPEIYSDKIHNIINAIVKYGASEVVIERGNADKELLNALRNIVDVKIL
ncbi:MAG: hypothetical protein K2K24_02780, partial [Clostridia bacterium]|nr:hypothetical protein [Clostridia bacterium]